MVNKSLASTTHYYDNTGKNFHCQFQEIGLETDKSSLTGDDNVNAEHPVYVRKAFEYARKFTSAKLKLRDTDIEFWNEGKSKAFYQLVKHLVNSGPPIDAVGFEGHLDLNKKNDWDKLTEAILKYQNLGLEVYITETDLADTTKIWNPAQAQKQKEQYALMMRAIVEANANWICFCGIQDKRNSDHNFHSLLFNQNLYPKPAYYGVQDGLLSLDSY